MTKIEQPYSLYSISPSSTSRSHSGQLRKLRGLETMQKGKDNGRTLYLNLFSHCLSSCVRTLVSSRWGCSWPEYYSPRTVCLFLDRVSILLSFIRKHLYSSPSLPWARSNLLRSTPPISLQNNGIELGRVPAFSEHGKHSNWHYHLVEHLQQPYILETTAPRCRFLAIATPRLESLRGLSKVR